MSEPLSIEQLWSDVGFKPNDNQKAAILHTSGPLYMPAGPGSGKTRTLLWRTLNLLVFHNVQPEEIYLSTFTEKAAFQLKEGLRSLLGHVTNRTGIPYDLSKMYIGTVHSLCQRLIADRRFYPDRQRGKLPVLLDELAQYFFLYRNRTWNALLNTVDLGEDPHRTINELFGASTPSKYVAVTNCISLFNRFSEECIDPIAVADRTTNPTLRSLLTVYDHYRRALQPPDAVHRTDFSLIQQKALEVLDGHPEAVHVFKHVIVDEYQDTNTIQEQLFFRLASGYHNICVVGDDDQALYRFRGATVENFVQFPERCQSKLGRQPTTIPLATNYRSRKKIVDFYTQFMDRWNWQGADGTSYRVEAKNIHAHSTDVQPSVVASTAGAPVAVCEEIAAFVRQLIDEKKVENPNQIAFLFPSLKYNGKMNDQVRRMKDALEAQGFRIYAPRASRFLEVEEAVAVFGILLHIFGKPSKGTYSGHDYNAYHAWIDATHDIGKELLEADKQLAQYVKDRRAELTLVVDDYTRLMAVVDQFGWDVKQTYDIPLMKRHLLNTAGLSPRSRKALGSAYLERQAQRRADEGQPFTLENIISRATAIDWSILDILYQLCGFNYFKRMLDLAENGTDEGPICNLGLISQYLSRFMDEYVPILTAGNIIEDRFKRQFFGSYIYALFRRGESEYEDADDPFPKGRIPFLTIHQSKGLEFPVVVLPNARKDNKGPQLIEELVSPLIDREGEPLARIAEFDIMRMFYVALSRAQNLLIVGHFSGQGQRINEPFKTMLHAQFPRIPYFNTNALPAATLASDDLPRNYSYTADYLRYQQCPRQYMLFRHYGLVPSRSQTMMFGSLVHRTMEDLHQYLIAQKATA